MAIHPLDVVIFQPGPKWWIDRLTLPFIAGGVAKTGLMHQQKTDQKITLCSNTHYIFLQ